MKNPRSVSLVLCLALLIGWQNETSAEPASQNSAVLTWNNDDRLNGQLMAFEDGYIHWQSQQFSDQLQIHSDYISAIDFPDPDEPSKQTERFRIQSQHGDVLFGDLVAIDQNNFTLQSDRLGEVRIKREHVRELQQLKHTDVLYDGPRWLDGWRTLRAGRMVSEWKATERGGLTTTKYNAELYRDLPRLDLAEINLVLRWTGKPGLQVDFSAPAELVAPGGKAQLSIKSWGDDLVATTSVGGTDFQPLLKLTERQTELRLRIVWDNKVGEATISSPDGKVHGRVLIDKAKKSTGLLIKNRSDNLTIEHIRLCKWNGISKSDNAEEGQSYLRLADGTLVPGEIQKLSNGKLHLLDGKEVDLAKVALAQFTTATPGEYHEHHVRFHDGTELSGKLVSIDAGYLDMKLASTRETVHAKRSDLDSIHCFQGRTDQFEFHLNGNGNRLSGNLAPVPNTEALGWAPIGSKTPVPIAVGTDQTIERRMGRSDASRPLGTEVIFLRDDSVLFGEVKQISAEGDVELTTSYTNTRKVPVSAVRAMEMLNGSGRVSFTDTEWEFTREARPLQQAQERIEISDPISMRHAKLDHSGKVSFCCTWDEDFSGLLSVHLGASTRQPRNSLVRFTFSQNRVSARSLLNASNSQTLPVFSERRANISIDTANKKATVWVNGIRVFQTDTKRQLEGTGLWLQGGSARSVSSGSGRAAKPRLIIDRLRIGDGAGRMGARLAVNQSLEMILKLPRNRVADAPKCVLCAANGDLLRGELLRLESERVRFKAGYEEVIVPRDEVSALVWLESPNAVAHPPQPDSLLLTLRDGSHLRVGQPKIQGSSIVGKHDLLSECRVPLDMVLRVENGTKPPQSPSTLVNWKLERTPEPKFVEDGAGDGLDSLLIGQNVSDVEVTLFDDSSLRLGDEERIIILDFWASWCAPCIRSLPRLVNLAKQYPDNQVRFIGVNVEENEFTIQGFLSSRGIEMEVATDLDASLSNKFGVKTIPQTIIIHKGKVERHFVGAPADLHKMIADSVTNLLPPTD